MKNTCIWVYGPPGSGKTSTLQALTAMRPSLLGFDSARIREQIYPELGFSDAHRRENIRHLAMLADTSLRAGSSCVVAAVTPHKILRKEAVDRISGRCVTVELIGRADPMWQASISTGSPFEWGGAEITIDTSKIPPAEVAAWIMEGRMPENRPRQLFIGRYQPPHVGHYKIIFDALKNGPVAIGVRDTPMSDENPYTLEKRIGILRQAFEQPPSDVVVFAVPDIDSIHYGRDVGYEIVQHDEVPGVSGKQLRGS